MKKLHLPFVALSVLVLAAVLSGCGAAGSLSTLTSGDAARLAGGGNSVVVTGQSQQGVIVSGTGVASADPQIAQVTFGVELQGQDPNALVSEAAQKMEAAMAAATSFGIAEDKTKTTNYSLWIETVYNPENGRPTGEVIYHLSHQVQVTTDKISSVGELLSGVVSAGANAVSGVNFTVEDSAALVEQARAAALADAKARAEHIASQLNISLGKPILVTEGGGDYPVYVERAALGMGGSAMDAASPTVTAGSFSVSVNVQIVYEIR
ncbi:MAG: SIMPL domain-containing protein [Anaerolineae bacterium]|jgi:hypothetical protein|nr:SIMPL domain-containing protein [Anaerolineae bacterium]